MPKSLSDLKIKNIKTVGNHRVAPKLYLHVKPKQKLWYIRKQVDGKRKWIYLGSYPAMSPTEAKKKASELLSAPVAPQVVIREAKQKKKASAAKESLKTITFAELAEQYIREIKRPVWTNNGRSEQGWRNTLNQYILPVLGNKQVEDITPADMVKLLSPIWTTKHETASRAMSRVENIIDFAIAKEMSDKRNPARYKNLLQNLLPAFKKKVRHHPALAFDETPGFASELWKKNEASHGALKLILLTQTRSEDARGAVWTDFNLQSGEWKCPIGS
jgi:hypothetical protein